MIKWQTNHQDVVCCIKSGLQRFAPRSTPRERSTRTQKDCRFFYFTAGFGPPIVEVAILKWESASLPIEDPILLGAGLKPTSSLGQFQELRALIVLVARGSETVRGLISTTIYAALPVAIWRQIAILSETDCTANSDIWWEGEIEVIQVAPGFGPRIREAASRRIQALYRGHRCRSLQGAEKREVFDKRCADISKVWGEIPWNFMGDSSRKLGASERFRVFLVPKMFFRWVMCFQLRRKPNSFSSCLGTRWMSFNPVFGPNIKPDPRLVPMLRLLVFFFRLPSCSSRIFEKNATIILPGRRWINIGCRPCWSWCYFPALPLTTASQLHGAPPDWGERGRDSYKVCSFWGALSLKSKKSHLNCLRPSNKQTKSNHITILLPSITTYLICMWLALSRSN